MSACIWETRPLDAAGVLTLAAELGLREPAARVLAGRGVTCAKEAALLLNSSLQELPDPFLLKDLDRACVLIEEALRRNVPIVAWGDYDMDGLSSLALLAAFFKSLNAPLTTIVPRRETEGYGLRERNVEELAARGVGLLITLDNGTSAVAEIARAKALGMNVIVVDHHQIGEVLPAADALLNPLREGCAYPDKTLAAVGLTFVLVCGLRRHLVSTGYITKEQAPVLRDLLDLVTMGTVADLVPLRHVNRIYVRHGLPLLTRSHRPGLMALKEVSRLALDGEVNTYTVGFILAPPINAAGRIGDPREALALLGADELPKARALAERLAHYNNERKLLESRVLEEALALLAKEKELAALPALVVVGTDWPEGVVGLVAARLVERFHKPSIVITHTAQGEARGSCRSIRALHMQQALQAVSEHLLRFGGHSQAAGFSIAPERIEAFRRAFLSEVQGRLSPEDYFPRCVTDGELPFLAIDHELLVQFERLAPYGSSFPQPSFIARGVSVARCTLLREKHLRLNLLQDGVLLEGIAFNMAERIPATGQGMDIVFVPEYNTFRGLRKIQLRILDMKPEGIDDDRLPS